MKKLIFAFTAILCLVMVSCGGSGYDIKTSDALVKKLSNGEKLSTSEYDTAIDLLEEGYEYCIEMQEDYTPVELQEKGQNDPDFQKILMNTAALATYLSFNVMNMTEIQGERFMDVMNTYSEVFEDY